MNSSRRGFVYPFRYAFVRSDENVSAVLFAVPKKGHKRAVERNLIRRRTREAYRLNKGLLGETRVNIALFYSSSQVHDFETIECAVQKILSQICRGVLNMPE